MVDVVFNPHGSSTTCGSEGSYGRFRRGDPRARLDLQGSVNPMLETSASVGGTAVLGPGVSDGWKCPFHARRQTAPNRRPRNDDARLQPQTGTAFMLAAGDTLRVIDPEGEQVADLIAFSRDARPAWLSAGRTFDYNNTVYLTTGHVLYSNRSRQC